MNGRLWLMRNGQCSYRKRCGKWVSSVIRKPWRPKRCLEFPRIGSFFLGYPDWGTEHIFMEHWGKDRRAFRSMLTNVREVPYANAYHPGAPYKGESVLADLEKLIAEFKPTKIFVSHPGDAHRDHRTFYLFAQIALWDLEDRLRPELYTYLIHYPHWPWPRGMETDRSLTPPIYFKDLAWSEQSLNHARMDRKAQALLLHRTQMAKDRKYLDSFVAENELFGNYPEIHLGIEEKGMGSPSVESVGFDETTSSSTEVRWRTIDQEGAQLVFRMDLNSRFHLSHPVTMYVFGYRHDRPFVEMPKLKLVVKGHQLEVFDQGRHVTTLGIAMERLDHTLVVRMPLEALGNPERLIGTAWSRSAEEPFDWRVWRVVDLRKKLIQ